MKKDLWKEAHEKPLLEVARLVGDRFDQLETIARRVLSKGLDVDGAAAMPAATAPAVLLFSTADGRAGQCARS